MKIEKYTIQACCGRTSVIFKTDQPLNTTHILELCKIGYTEHKHFTKAGILYVDNSDFILTGPLGSDRLQVKCKMLNCDSKLIELEQVLLKLE
jgi:hypothetical protein